MAEPDGLSSPYWNGLRENRLLVEHRDSRVTWQFGPEWLCLCCHAVDPTWKEDAPRGRIYNWEWVWHPSHNALVSHGSYLAVLVELPEAGNVRMAGNLLGEPLQEAKIGAAVLGAFEHHPDADPPYSLLHWRQVRHGD